MTGCVLCRIPGPFCVQAFIFPPSEWVPVMLFWSSLVTLGFRRAQDVAGPALHHEEGSGCGFKGFSVCDFWFCSSSAPLATDNKVCVYIINGSRFFFMPTLTHTFSFFVLFLFCFAASPRYSRTMSSS